MRIERADPSIVKGWYLGPWSSDLPITLGYAPKWIDEPHAFLSSSPDYFHVVFQTPGLQGKEA